jgi:hypothetical protein
MFSYHCENCGASWTVYALCLDCPFCHVEHWKRQRYSAPPVRGEIVNPHVAPYAPTADAPAQSEASQTEGKP